MYHMIQHCSVPIKKVLTIPGSKEITYRAILLASLADGISELHNIRNDAGTKSLIHALQQLGIVIQHDEQLHTCVIAGCNGSLPSKQASLWCDKIEPTVYYLLGLTSMSPGIYFFDCPPQLRQLTSTTFLNALKQQGVQFIPYDAVQMPFTLAGTDSLLGGTINFQQPLHPQVLSILLMIAPFARKSFSFLFEQITQPGSIQLTCPMKAEFGVLVHRIHQNQFMVPVPQRYHAHSYVIEPDVTIAAYFFAAAAITNGELSIPTLSRTACKQNNIKILNALEKMGCTIIENAAQLTVRASHPLNGIEINMKDFSDMFIIIAALAPFAQEPTTITHIGATREEEAMLLKNFSQALLTLQIDVEIGTNWITIFPSRPRGARVDTFHNPKLGMAYALLGLRIPNIQIENADCVTQIYPDFFKMWESLLPQHAPVT